MAGTWRQILAKEKQQVNLKKNRKSRISAFIKSIEELRANGADPVEISNKFYVYVDCMINEGYPRDLVKEAIKEFNSGIKSNN
jgi:hypothetical protein